MLKAIETRYDGRFFRSRAEARWAVFFNRLGIAYEYEPEGFSLPDGRGYLPDFRIYVPSLYGPQPLYIEVKGTLEADDGKAEQLAWMLGGYSRVCVVPAIDHIREACVRDWHSHEKYPTKLFFTMHGRDVKARTEGMFTLCKHCNSVGFEPGGTPVKMRCCGAAKPFDYNRAFDYDAERWVIQSAVDDAISHRFGT